MRPDSYGAQRSAVVRCPTCGFKVGNTGRHIAWHVQKGDSPRNLIDDSIAGTVVAASAAAGQRALRARAHLLLKPSRAQRTEELRRRAREIRGADD